MLRARNKLKLGSGSEPPLYQNESEFFLLRFGLFSSSYTSYDRIKSLVTKRDHKQDQKSHQLLHLRLFFISFSVKGKRSNSIAAFCVEKRLLFFREKAKSFSTALFTDIINDFYNIAATVCSASVVLVERSRSIVDIAKGDTFVCKYFRPPAPFRKIDYC